MTRKLEDSNTAPKTYWTILNRLLYNKKIPIIPPLFVNGNFVSDFNSKANLFNNFFASICTPIENASLLPTLTYKTDKRIKSFNINDIDIISIIKSLNPNKAHGYDNLSIRIIKNM